MTTPCDPSPLAHTEPLAGQLPAGLNVLFNHLYVVLDDKTYRSILGSDFLRTAFPGFERRATLTAAGEKWNGAYFYLRDNYLEFFPSGSSPVSRQLGPGGHWQPGAQEGWAGLAFSVSRPGGAQEVRTALQEAFRYEPFSELRQLRTGEKTVRWFYHTRIAERLGLGSFESWVMEYHPEIFAHKGLPIPESGELTTAAYLAMWNENLGADDPTAQSAARRVSRAKEQVKPVRGILPKPQPVFSHIAGATIHLDPARAERFAAVLTLLGYEQTETEGALVLSAHGFRLEISLAPHPNGYRLSALRMAMARPSVAPVEFVFAPSSRLVLNRDQTADWYFGV